MQHAAVVDNLNTHSSVGPALGPTGTDVLLSVLAHPRWEFVFQPTYAAYLNLIERGTVRATGGRSYARWR